MINAVIFDLDGVIVSTDDCRYKAWKRMADEEGIYFDKEINKRLRSVSRGESLEIIFERAEKEYSAMEKEHMSERKNNYYKAFITKLTKNDILPGAMKALEELKSNGIKIAIGSSSKNTPIILKRIGLDDYFDAVSDGKNISKSKPEPEIFVKASDMLGIVEDADAGVEAGKRAGMKTVAVHGAKGADIELDNLENVSLYSVLKFNKYL